MMMPLIWKLAAGAGAVFLLAQLARPEVPYPPVTAELQAPAAVRQILRKACYDCHSNETRLAWFDKIVPASWLVARDVKRARARLNFSEIGTQPAARQRAALFEAVNHIQMGAMPLRSYTQLHPDAAVTVNEVAVLRDYLQPAAPHEDHAVDTHLIFNKGRSSPVRNAPNGIAFLPDYKNWQAISITDRHDTNSFKLILGNEVAAKAIAANTINPWPDGTAFAKVSWRQQSGEFAQVAFMIKDAKRYASTAGWGWAEWLGTELKPYGKDSDFAVECVACHAPLRKNDYVFTMPIPPVRKAT